MTIEVKGVSSIVKDVERVKQRASKAADSLKHSIGSIDQALDVVKDLDDTLSSAARELNEVLGVETNNPPTDEVFEEDGGAVVGGIGPAAVASAALVLLIGSFLLSSLPGAGTNDAVASTRSASYSDTRYEGCRSLTGLQTRLLSICRT